MHAVAAGRRRGQAALRREPADGMAPGELVLGGAGAGLAQRASRQSSRTSSIVRSTERSPRLSSSRRLALVLVKAREGTGEARRVDGPSPRSRASEIADETLWVSASVSRRASISVSEYWRWPPAERWGLGKPIAAFPAAQRVRADPEHDRSSVRPDSVLGGVISSLGEISKVRNVVCTLAAFVRQGIRRRAVVRAPEKHASEGAVCLLDVPAAANGGKLAARSCQRADTHCGARSAL